MVFRIRISVSKNQLAHQLTISDNHHDKEQAMRPLRLLIEIAPVTTVVLLIIFLVPVVVYGLFSRAALVQAPENASPARFLTGILVSKLAVALAFVTLFAVTQPVFAEKWLLYAAIWWGMLAADEVGQAVSGSSTWPEAAAGIISEAIYFPASAFVVQLLVAV